MFDGQAELFEQRAGLPENSCRDIAMKVIEIGQIGPGDLIVEVGSGTGQIGQWFKSPTQYAGFDLSKGMLGQFNRRLTGDSTSRVLIHADGNANWPFANGVARVIFSSRAMHLLQQEHAVSEVFRIASPDGAKVILGRVERKPESVRALMAKEMIERLRRYGFVGRRGERKNQELIELCCRRGAVALEPVSVATWTVLASPRRSLDSWRSVTQLGGIKVPETTKADILHELEGWAKEVFGGLDEEVESEESYVLNSFSLPGTHET